MFFFFFFKQKTAYEMRISDWSSDVCSSDLKMDWAVREAVLKEDPIASQLNLRFAGSNRTRAIKIKLEIDTNPPAGSGEATTFLDFPADYEVRHQDLPSNFALKVHALLCRPYQIGRASCRESVCQYV